MAQYSIVAVKHAGHNTAVNTGLVHRFMGLVQFSELFIFTSDLHTANHYHCKKSSLEVTIDSLVEETIHEMT